jgi:hypothetical protein
VTAGPRGLPGQVRTALEEFVQDVLDHPANRPRWRQLPAAARASLAGDLWREAVVLVFRLLFALRAEATGLLPPAGAVSSLPSGPGLEGRLREVFAALNLGGRFFRPEETPLLETRSWGDDACDRLLRGACGSGLSDHPGADKPDAPARDGCPPSLARRACVGRGRDPRPEDLGDVYEHLLDLEPGLATAPMVRLRRGSLEVVVPAEQGRPYREAGGPGHKTRVKWVEEIIPVAGSPGAFYLRAAPGRKTSGSYTTPLDLVRFLVEETLRPQVEALSPTDDPRPRELLTLTVLDPALGSGPFLLGACRFLGNRLHAACRACAARGLWDRIPAEIAAHLTDDRPEARALCKELVARHCLYGVDRNAFAVEVARASLWLEVGSRTLPWAVLERRLVHGDSLTGPFSTDLPHLTRPPGPAPPGPLEREFLLHLRGAADRARSGLDEALLPFRVVALAWAGAVMLRGEPGATGAYRELLAHVADHADLPEPVGPAVLRLLRHATGLAPLPPERDALAAALRHAPLGSSDGPPLSFDLTFPEVFFPNGAVAGWQGFHAVLCNPPWDAIRPAEKEFFAAHDLAVLDAPTARERSGRIEELSRRPEVARAWSAYRARLAGQKACHDRLYRHQKVLIGNDLAGRYSDNYRVFAERAADLLRPGGYAGLVLPAAFHANEGATGVRRLYLEEMALQCCYSFENRRRLFPIDGRCKFALVVARRGGPTAEFPCAFYLHDPAWLSGREPLRYSLEFVRRTGGEYLTFVEARGPGELRVLNRMLDAGRPLRDLEETHRLVFRTEPYAFNVTTHGPLFTAAPAGRTPKGYLVLQEGKGLHQYTDRWGRLPRYLVHEVAAAERPAALPNARYYRLAFRTIAHATNERTAIFAVLPPGVLVANSVAVEAAPGERPNTVALWACAVLNSFAFDLSVRLKGGANMNLFIMRTGLVPAALPEAFLAHAALRLVCNHAGFAPLWREQVGEAWRGPVLDTEAERWEVRAAVDAVVAAAYGFTREEYACFLGTFRHRSQPRAAEWALEKFDDLLRQGEETFTRRHDPFWAVPLNPALPQPIVP